MDGSVDSFLRRPSPGASSSYMREETSHAVSQTAKNLRHVDFMNCRNTPAMDAFPKPGGPSMIVLYEKDGYFTHVPSNSLEASRNPYLADHPAIFMSKEALKGSSKDNFQSVFLVQHDSTLKNIVVAWREGGFVNLLEEVLRASESQRLPAAFLKAIHCTLSVLQWSKKIYQSLSPHKMLPTDVMISTFSSTRNWSASPIRCIAWHPQNRKVAVGFSDDSVRIYGLQYVVPMLKNRRQKNVGAIAWRYNTSCDIAVGCQGCVLLWRLDPNTVAAKPSSSFLTVINHPTSTGPVVSLSWNSKSEWLAFGTCTDSTLVLWDIHTETQVSVPDAASGGITQVIWSKDGQRLVCTSPLIPFRIFTFEPTISSIKSGAETGRVHTVAWTPCGHHLIFADSENPRLYGLSLQVAEGGIRKLTTQPFVLAETTETIVECQSGDEVRTGGLVQSVMCDDRGERVAALFRHTHTLAVYSLKMKPLLQVEPLGIICGNDEDHPVSACFQPSFENGSLLSVGWSTGRVQHVPMFRSSDSDVYGRSSNLSSSFRLFGDSVLSPKLYSMQG